MKEYIVIIIGIILLLPGFYLISEYNLQSKGWTDYLIAGLVLYVIIIIALFILVRRGGRSSGDFIPDTKYTRRFERV